MTTLGLDVEVTLDRFRLEVALELGAHVTGIFGPSGSGKSTLLELVAGLRRPDRGHVRFGSESWTDVSGRRFVPPERRGVGYVPQAGLLFPHLNVQQNLRLGCGRAPGDRVAATALLLELEPLLGRDVTTLSGGERQRVALGRALCSGPRLLLLDEPLGALDRDARRRLLPVLVRACRETEATALFVSHDPAEVLALATEVVVLEAGRVRARGSPRDLLTRPEMLDPDDGFENLLSGTVTATDDDHCTVHVAGTTPLVARARGARLGSEVLLSLRASDVMVAVRAPKGLSARNSLPARVRSIEGARRRLVRLELAPEVELVAELTEAACTELGVASGAQVQVVFKASACRVHGG